MVSGKKFILFLAALCCFLMPLLNCGLIAAAQDDSTEVLDLLMQDAEKNGKTLGEYLWNLLHGKYKNLGDLAANSLERYLEKGLNRTVTISGTTMTVTIRDGDESNGEFNSEAFFDVTLKNDDDTESGVLTLHMDAIKDYVNERLYPVMEDEMSSSDTSAPLLQDLDELLSHIPLNSMSGSTDSTWTGVWNELTGNLDNYPAVKSLLEIPSEKPLISIAVDEETTESETLEEIFNASSGADLLDTFNTIGADPIPETLADRLSDKVSDLVNGEPENQGMNGHGGYWFLVDTELPATGFSAAAGTQLREQPMSLSYGKTNMLLQIPKLDVEEMILTVERENGRYAIEWLGSNAGLLAESSLPGEGITVLTGHNHLNTAEIGPFLFIGTLENEDRIFITDAENNLYSYKVYANHKIPSDGFASIADDLRENSLVLITCEDESVDGSYLNRRVVFAEPI